MDFLCLWEDAQKQERKKILYLGASCHDAGFSGGGLSCGKAGLSATWGIVSSVWGNESHTLSYKSTLLGEVMVPGSGKLLESLLYPFLTQAWVYVIALGSTMMLFSYRLADRVLLRIHASRILQISLASVAILMVVVSMGRCFLLFELLMMLLMAGIIYPFPQQPSSPRGKARWQNLGSGALEKQAA